MKFLLFTVLLIVIASFIFELSNGSVVDAPHGNNGNIIKPSSEWTEVSVTRQQLNLLVEGLSKPSNYGPETKGKTLCVHNILKTKTKDSTEDASYLFDISACEHQLGPCGGSCETYKYQVELFYTWQPRKIIIKSINRLG